MAIPARFERAAFRLGAVVGHAERSRRKSIKASIFGTFLKFDVDICRPILPLVEGLFFAVSLHCKEKCKVAFSYPPFFAVLLYSLKMNKFSMRMRGLSMMNCQSSFFVIHPIYENRLNTRRFLFVRSSCLLVML